MNPAWQTRKFFLLLWTMASSEAGASRDDGWRYCSVCKKNHEEGRKHIFTKKHQSKLKIIMGKFLKKARSARRCLGSPVVHAGELEPGAKVWCYCCDQEVNKHVTDGSVSVELGGLIEHMTKPEHHTRTRHYWWEHGAETKQLQTLLLFPAEYQRYKERVATALDQLETTQQDRVSKLADEMRAVEQQQAVTALEPPISCQPIKKPSRSTAHCSKRPPPLLGHTQNLSSVKRQDAGSVRGNVHTGATPPWLRDDEGEEEGGVAIGPSEEEFIKHKERLRHAGKNPRRVGADFHLKLALQKHRGEKEDNDWLPSFGRVWNAGPRSHTKTEFKKELALGTKSHIPSSTSYTHHLPPTRPHTPTCSTLHTSLDPLSPHTSNDQPASPYSRKRPWNETELDKHNETKTVVDNTSSELTVKPYVRKRKICKEQS